jgi:hypothetical protein
MPQEPSSGITLLDLLRKLKKAKTSLEDKLEYLKSKGISIKSITVDETIAALVVTLDDMEAEYADPIRNIVGYDLPILFEELEIKVLVGKP